MSTVEGGSPASGMVKRIRDLLLQPTITWAEIDGEPATIGGLYKGWIVPLVAISVVSQVIGALVFGYGMFGVSYRPGVVGVIAGAVVTFLLQMAVVYAMALIVEALAPSFGGQKNRIQAFKVVAYGSTAAWLAGIFQIYPPLALLGVVGLYSLWLYFRGLPRLMKTGEEKALPYTAVVVVAAIVLMLIVGAITAPIMAMTATGAMGGDRGRLSGEVTLPGGATVDMAEVEKSTRQLEAVARQMEDGSGTAAVEAEALKAYLPEAVAGYVRTEVSTGSGGAAGMSGSGAEGSYAKGEATLRLSVTDLGSAAPLAAMAGAFNVSSSSEKGAAYEKVGKVDGRMTIEKFDRDASRGEYGVLVADRFMVQAQGEGVSMNELKAAVAAVDPASLETLAERS